MTNITNLEAAIAEERRKANERIERLRRKAKREEDRIHSRMIVLLREGNPDEYAVLRATAEDDLATRRQRRSRRAKTNVEHGHETTTGEVGDEFDDGGGAPFEYQ